MSRFLLAAELGGAYGHASRLLALAEELKRRGHAAIFCLRDLFVAETVLGRYGFRYLQAPTFIGVAPAAPTPASYPGVLFRRGYYRAESVLGLLKGWLEVFDHTEPDFVVADFAPTAMLAARLRRLPAGAIGNGFVCPPRLTPMPILPGHAMSKDHQLRLEGSVLDNINAALAAFSAAPLEAVADLFPPVDDVVCTFPEIDHYGARPGRTYWGAIDASFGKARVAWPDAAGPRIFAYLEATHPGLRPLVADLGRSGYPTIIHVRGLTGDGPGVSLRGNIAASNDTLDVACVLDDTSLVVCHASHGVVSKALLRGVPLLALPSHYEQALVGVRIAAMGAGLAAPAASGVDFDYAWAIERLLNEPAFALRAATFAATYADFDVDATVRLIADFYESLLAGHPRRVRPSGQQPTPDRGSTQC